MSKTEMFVIGVDFGTDSVRSVLVNALNGEEVSASVFYYPRWRDGLYCNASVNIFRQHPLDYLEGLEDTIKRCLVQAGPSVASGVRAISIDTTGSTPVAVDEQGRPLALLPGFEENPDAMFVLWKDHSSVKEAAEINARALKDDNNYLKFVGGIYSSEWFWAKLLRVLRSDDQVRNACYSWVEHCDWMPFVLTGRKLVKEMKRSVCAAGHKALWSETWGGLPADTFFFSIDPLLKGFVNRLYDKVYTSDHAAGQLCKEWAAKLGLSENVIIGIGAFDAHMGAVGGQIEPYHLSKVMGTSTCDMLVAPVNEIGDKMIGGICGQVPGSIIPGMMGMEAGQSAFGDAYSWFIQLLSWPMQALLPKSTLIDAETAEQLLNEVSGSMMMELNRCAMELSFDIHSELAVDWLNGRRTPFASQELKAVFSGLNLGTDAPKLFRSLAEATCFGAKAIVDCFRDQGVAVNGLIGLGGVAKKSPFIMQMMADVMNMPIRIHKSEQTCAAGAAMFAATACGIYNHVEEAMRAMGRGFDKTYQPSAKLSALYEKRFNLYKEMGKFTEKQTLQQVE